jgi:hypothetical protein
MVEDAELDGRNRRNPSAVGNLSRDSYGLAIVAASTFFGKGIGS